MRISRIYTQAILQISQLVALEEKSSHHLSKVLRQKIGSSVILFNGDGYDYSGQIDAIDKRSVSVKIASREIVNNESPLKIHLGIAVSKGDRMDWIIQKSTELGVDEITPLLSARTEVKFKGDRKDKKQLHWQQIVISACEQSGRSRLPNINPIQSLTEWTETTKATKKFVLHHRTTQQLDSHDDVDLVCLLIGPEGGLSEDEIGFAEEHQFSALQLGPRILRTETAPLAAISILQHTWGDM
ncbi:MAG: 16S rRNA (uracil(1498)-N(3))-methyltransferase [Oceanicoccus sp.]